MRQRPLSFPTSGELAFTQFPYGRKLLYGRGVLRRRASISLGCVVAASAGGCGGHQSTTSFDNLKPPAAKPRLAAPGASVQIAAPTAGSKQPSTFTARIRVSGFHVIGGQGPRRQGYGHLHFVLDRGRYDQPRYAGANGQLALRLGVNG